MRREGMGRVLKNKNNKSSYVEYEYWWNKSLLKPGQNEALMDVNTEETIGRVSVRVTVEGRRMTSS